MSTIQKSLHRAAALLCLAVTVFAFSGCNRPQSEAASSKNVRIFTNANFQSGVLEAKEPVLVDFWAAWCGPCKQIAPIVSQLADEFEGRAKVGKVDVDAQTALAKRYNISAIPTLLIFKDGKVVEQVVGLRGKGELKAMLAKHAGETTTKTTTPAQ